MSRFLTSSIIIALALTLTGPLVASAQDATPGTTTDCSVAPRPADELLVLWYDPSGTPITPAASSSPVASEGELPSGTEADPETVAAINDVMQQWAACFNAGDFGRYFALITDDLARQQGPQQGESREEARALIEGTPVAQPSDQGLMIGPARHVRVLPDGRAGAIFDFEQAGYTGVVFVVFEQLDGQWLIDDTIQVGLISGTPTTG